jgi:membrane protein DedA with SNARE-associated domain
VSKMRWHIFLAANAAGGILWAAIYTFAAYLAGSAFERLSKTLNIVLLICGAIAIVAALLAVRHEFGKYADRAEAAYPGPLELSPVRGEGKDEDTWVLACYGS